MAEQGFEEKEVGAALVHVSGEAMAQGVDGELAADGVEANLDAGEFGGFVDDAVDGAGGDVEDDVVEAEVFGVLGEEARCLGVDEDVTIFVGLAAADEEDVAVEVEVGDAQGDEFLAADAGGVEDADDEMVALVISCDVEHFLNVTGREDGGESEAFALFLARFFPALSVFLIAIVFVAFPFVLGDGKNFVSHFDEPLGVAGSGETVGGSVVVEALGERAEAEGFWSGLGVFEFHGEPVDEFGFGGLEDEEHVPAGGSGEGFTGAGEEA